MSGKMVPKNPLYFDESGSKAPLPGTPSTGRQAYDWYQEHIGQPVAGTVLGMDPIGQVMHGEGNIGDVFDPVLNYGKALRSQFGGPPVQDWRETYHAVEAAKAQTPQWVQRTMEGAMGAHPAMGGVPRAFTPQEFAKKAMEPSLAPQTMPRPATLAETSIREILNNASRSDRGPNSLPTGQPARPANYPGAYSEAPGPSLAPAPRNLRTTAATGLPYKAAPEDLAASESRFQAKPEAQQSAFEVKPKVRQQLVQQPQAQQKVTGDNVTQLRQKEAANRRIGSREEKTLQAWRQEKQHYQNEIIRLQAYEDTPEREKALQEVYKKRDKAADKVWNQLYSKGDVVKFKQKEQQPQARDMRASGVETRKRMIDIAKREHELAKQTAEALPPRERQLALKNAAKEFQDSVEKVAQHGVNPNKGSKYNWDFIADHTYGKKWADLTTEEQNKLKIAQYNTVNNAKRRGGPAGEKPLGRPPGTGKDRLVPGVGRVKQLSQEQQSLAKASPEKIAIYKAQSDRLLRDVVTKDTGKDIETSLEQVRTHKVLPGPMRNYLGKLHNYLFRPAPDSGSANSIVNSYRRITGDKFNVPVPIKDLYQAYLDRTKEGTTKDFVSNKHEQFAVKDFETFKKHLYTFGKRIDESYGNEIPNHAAPWIIDGDKAILSPYVPGMEEARAEALPLDTGVQTPAPKAKPLIPDIPTGRIPGETGYKVRYKGTESGTPFQPVQASGRRNLPPGQPPGGPAQPPQNPRGRRNLVNPDIQRNRWMRTWKEIEKVVSPASVSENQQGLGAPSRAAERIIRSVEGEGRRQVAQNIHSFDPYFKEIAKLDPAQRLDFVDYVQGGPSKLPDPALKALADNLKRIYQGYEAELRALPRYQSQTFIQDYLPQMWKKHLEANKIISAHTFTEERGIPTYKEGIARGLEPITLDPIDMTMRYMESMRRFLDRQYIIRQGVDAGYIKMLVGPVKKIPVGARIISGARSSAGFALYANEDFARVMDNYLSKGFRGNQEIGGVYNGLLRMTNGATAIQLGMSAFHTLTMTKEAYLAALADGIKQGVKGNMGSAAKKFASSPAAAVTFYLKGRKLVDAYLADRPTGNTTLNQIADLAGRSNVKLGELDEIYRASALGGYWQTIRRGLAGTELRNIGQGLKSAPFSTVGQVAGRLIETVAQPLFYHYIPRLKAGVFMERMADYLKDNPTASPSEQIAHAQRIADVVDDQFGELVQNNLFWDAHLKQTANLLLTSTGWTLGTMRLFGQGATDLLRSVGKVATTGKRQPLTDRGAYVIATTIGVSALNALYQALKTGTSPQGTTDLVAPKTGGRTATGDEERAILPGYEKDLMGWWHDPQGEAFNKLGALPKLAYEEFTNKDWRQDPIRDPNQTSIAQMLQSVGHALSAVEPLSLKEPYGVTPHSNLNWFERHSGVRPAGGWVTNPARSEAMQKYYGEKATTRKSRHEAIDKARRGMKWEDFPSTKPAKKSTGMRWDELR